MSSAPLSLQEFQEIYSKVPRLCVELIVQHQGGMILTKRSIPPYEGMWHIPGGTVLFGETVDQAVDRVADDELGIKVEIKRFVGFIVYPQYKQDGLGWPIGAAYLVTITRGELQGSEQGEEVKIFRSLPENMLPGQREFLIKQKILIKE